MSDEGRLDLDEIRALIQIVTEAEITELDVDAPHIKVRIKKGSPATHAVVHLPNPGTPAAAPETGAKVEAAQEAGYLPIVAPMVGTFYRSPKPDAPPFVEEGDDVEAGQTVCILEAMKLFNEIPSEVAGRIVRVVVDNGTPVEYGQPLFLLDPSPAS